MTTTLLIATRNAHKVQEIRQILCGGFSYLTLNDFPNAPAVVEDADTFNGNAQKKAVSLAQWLAHQPTLLASKAVVPSDRFYVLADDSGLEVDALNGAPGVHSARFAALDAKSEGNTTDAANNAKLLRLLQNVPTEKRTARFRCVLALTPVGEIAGETILVEGACEGRISHSPAGKGGFGYDPLFVPNGYEKSFAELGEEIKNQLSHRANALEKLKMKLG